MTEPLSSAQYERLAQSELEAARRARNDVDRDKHLNAASRYAHFAEHGDVATSLRSDDQKA